MLMIRGRALFGLAAPPRSERRRDRARLRSEQVRIRIMSPVRRRHLSTRWIDVTVALIAVLVVFAILSVAASNRSDEASGATYITPTHEAPPTFAPLTVGRQANGQARILMTGDSLSSGFFTSAPEKSFTEIVAATIGNVEATRVSLTNGDLITVGRVAAVPDNLNLAVLELGTNDVGHTDIPTFTTQYQTLVDRIVSTSPGVALICAGVWRTDGAEYDMIIEQTCESAGGRFVQMSGIFRQSGIRGPAGVQTWRGVSDDFHPNDVGHSLIARSILRAIGLA
jgi:acyl-CoA thioesterase-1